MTRKRQRQSTNARTHARILSDNKSRNTDLPHHATGDNILGIVL